MENYAEYVDYNSTTTQSDRGDMLYTLLDYLRLRASYDRVAWNLQPVVLAHEVLVRSGHDEAADVWRAAVAERTSSIAEDHLKRFQRLNRKYGMRLPSIADRLGERFVRPLVVDRLCALIEPAMDEAHDKARPAGRGRTATSPAPSRGWKRAFRVHPRYFRRRLRRARLAGSLGAGGRSRAVRRSGGRRASRPAVARLAGEAHARGSAAAGAGAGRSGLTR